MAATAPRPAGNPLDTARSTDATVGIAAHLCWHAFRICQAIAASLDALQDDLAEISAHCDALIEMAIDLDRETPIPNPIRSERGGRP